MTTKQLKIILAMLAAALILAALILRMEPPSVGEEEGSEAHHEGADANNGPHHGQMFAGGNDGIEVRLSEEGGEPHFRIYQYQHDKPVKPQAGQITVTLTRPTGEPEAIDFEVNGDFLVSRQTIAEPHVFEARINLKTAEGDKQFELSKAEGKIELSEQQIADTGIELRAAQPAKIKTFVTLPGEVRFNEDRTSHVVPRVPGIVEEIQANLGQQVRKGQLLAVLASASLSEQRSELLSAQKRLELARSTYEREKHLWESKISAEQDYLQARQVLSEAEIALHNAQQKLLALGAQSGQSKAANALSRYEIHAPFDGMVVEKHIALGEAVKEDSSIFTITDLSSVWAEIVVSAKDLSVVRVGEPVTIRATAMDSVATGTVSYVGALIGEQTRTAKARVTLANPQLAWRPGLFINVELVSKQTDAAVAVASNAIQTIKDQPVVFMRVPGGFLAQPVEIGLSDNQATEIVKGLEAGTQYAVNGSYVLKSEQGKAGASHEH
ncbi:efflux RND transporter periplasmic adaptor subunit [Methylomonas sp. 2BW1-5-20]|uniref:efflux RND transporter periplasmic adaptor subunit n=1 Tax=Methylomonas sp. 2BW1-5-20 TaxID=3376686 RepID=UPI00404D5A6C